MSNKAQLQANNENLASILSNVLGLPSQESVKHGAYVWKKYTLTYSETSRANAGEETIPDIGSLHTAIKVYMSKSYTFDKTTGTFTLVNPSTTTVAYGQSYVFDGEYYFMVNGSTGDKMFKSAGISSSSHQTKILNLNDRVYLKACSTSYAFYVYSNTANKVDFVDFVVSDSPTTYPDEGEQDGYWYEKVAEGIDLLSLLDCTQLAVDVFTYTSNVVDNQTVSHSLGVIPKFAIIIAKELKNTTTTYFHYKSSYIFNDGGSGYSVTEYLKSGNQSLDSQYTPSTATNTTIKLGGTNSLAVYFKAGVEYTLITMA